MRGVERLRRDQRKNILDVVIAQIFLLLRLQALVRIDDDVAGRELLDQLGKQRALTRLDLAQALVAFGDLLLRRTPVGRQLVHAGDHLMLQSADALHEKLVDGRASDGEELHPLKERIAVVFGFGQYALIEREPGQLAIEVKLGRIERIVKRMPAPHPRGGSRR